MTYPRSLLVQLAVVAAVAAELVVAAAAGLAVAVVEASAGQRSDSGLQHFAGSVDFGCWPKNTMKVSFVRANRHQR